MKPTFLNQTRPLITSMIQMDNPDSIRFGENIMIDGGRNAMGRWN